MKINLPIFMIAGVLLSVVEMKAQALNGEMQASFYEEPLKINTESDKALLIVHSEIPNLRFDSNRKIEKVEMIATGTLWHVWLPPGTHILKISCMGYQLIELQPFNFMKQRTYGLQVKEVRAPRPDNVVGGKGSLFVSSEPEGAELTIDGMPGTWTTPATIKNILATTWQLALTRPRYDTLIIKATVFHDSLLRLENQKLSPRFGFLKIDAANDAFLFLNGTKHQYTRNENIEVPIGLQRVTLKKMQYADFDTTVNVTSGMTYALQANLAPLFAFLKLEDFQESEVFVDGYQAALSTNIKLSTGTHKVRMSNKQYGENEKSYVFSSGEVKVIRLNDFLDPGFLNLSTDVPADIYVDDKYAGKDTARFETTPGEHIVKFVHPNLREVNEIVNIQSKKEKHIFIPMLPSRSTALWRCLIPGTSQIYTNQSTRGYLYLASFLASAAVSVYYYVDYTVRKADYDVAANNYSSAVTQDKIALYRNQIISQYDKLDQARKFRNIGLISTAAVYTISFLDRLIFSPHYGYRQRESNISMEIRSNPNFDGVQLTWTISR
jgi:hypothetical protein